MNDLENKVYEEQIEVPMMTGELGWSGITETNLVEDEKK